MAFLRTVIRCSVHKKYGLLINNLQNGSFGKIDVNQIVLKSTAASSTTIVDSKSSASVNNPPRDPLDITFEDAKAAFKSKTNLELIRAYVVYTLCSFETLVENNMKLMKLAKGVLGERLFIQLMKSTFYGHFVAGEDQYKIRPKLERLRSFGVKPILDYSVEEDLSQEEAEKREVEASVPEAGDQVDAEAGALKQYHVDKTFADRRYKVQSARTYFYLNEATCERNMEIFLKCLEAIADFQKSPGNVECKRLLENRFKLHCKSSKEVLLNASAENMLNNQLSMRKNFIQNYRNDFNRTLSGATYGTGITAIKLTALGRPQLLLQLSEVIMRTRKYMTEIVGGEGNVLSHHMKPEDLEAKFSKISDRESLKKFLKQVTYDKQGSIDGPYILHLFPWSGIIDENQELSTTFRVPDLKTGRMARLITQLSTKEEEMFRNMIRRVNTIVKAAKDMDVRIMVDAEQTYFQPAISRITLEFMRKYNKEKAIVFNTYQCYLRNALSEVTTDLEQAKRQDFYFGAKLVRGAYLEQERARAAAMGYPDPTNPNFEATSEMYHSTLTECLRRIKAFKDKGEDKKIAIMVASHNEDTVRFAIEKMKEFGIEPSDKVICFGQLLAMCDYITFPLGQSGYSAYKYIPYGPVNEVLPYLSRRAHENKGVLQKIKKEKRLLAREIMRRMATGQIWYTPKGNYVPV